MKKMQKIISCVLCAASLFCMFAVQSFAEDRINTNETVHLYGDIDGNGKIEQSDFDYILAVATGEQEKPAVGSLEYMAADIMGDGITMEDARRCYRYINGLDTADTYVPADREVELFNKLVNIIKSENFRQKEKMTYYSYNNEHMETNNFDFGSIYTPVLKPLFDEEMEDVETYTALRKGATIYCADIDTTVTTNYPAASRSVVSSLTANDIKSMTIEYGVPCTFSTDIGLTANEDGAYSYTVGTGDKVKTYDLTYLVAQEAAYTDCIKITVEIKDESYKNDTSKLPEGVNTALYNLYGEDINAMGAEYPMIEDESSSGITMKMTANLGDINTTGKVVYYFDSKTLNPMAAGYCVEVNAQQEVEIYLEALEIKIEGTMDPSTQLTTKDNFWFDSYFPAPQEAAE